MSEVLESLSAFVRAWCAAEDEKRRRSEALRRLEHEINWTYARLSNPQIRMSPRQRGELRHQIRHKEIEIAFLDAPRTLAG